MSNPVPVSPILVQALFPYAAVSQDDLSFPEGAILEVHDSEDSWLYGVHVATGNKGWFPDNYVGPPTTQKMIDTHVPSKPPPPPPSHPSSASACLLSDSITTPSVSSSSPPPSVQQQGRVLYDYTAQKQGELNLTTGELITINSTDIGIHGWFRGTSSNGELGIFPSNYVRLLDQTTSSVEDKQRKIASYGIRIGIGITPALSNLPPLKKVSSPVSPSLDSLSIPTSASIHNEVTTPSRRSPPTPVNTTATPTSPTSQNRITTQPKLPVGLASPNPCSPVPPAFNTDNNGSSSMKTDVSLTRASSLSNKSSLPAVSSDSVIVTGGNIPEEKLQDGEDTSIVTTSERSFPTHMKARPAPAKRPPTSLRNLVESHASSVPTLTSGSTHDVSHTTSHHESSSSNSSLPQSTVPPLSPTKRTSSLSPSPSPTKPSIPSSSPLTMRESPEPDTNMIRTSSTNTTTSTTNTTTAPSSGKTSRVSSAIANLQANLALQSGNINNGNHPPSRPPPSLPGAKPIFTGLLRRQTSTSSEKSVTTSSTLPEVNDNNVTSIHRNNSASPLSNRSRSPSPVPVGSTNVTGNQRIGSSSPTRMTQINSSSIKNNDKNTNPVMNDNYNRDESDIPSVQTLWDMVSALKIELSGLRASLMDEHNARVTLEHKLNELMNNKP